MKRTIRDIRDWQGKRALVREDFNVPMNEQGEITDDTRIREALPTLRYLSEQGARVIIASHLGRPKGESNPAFSMRPVAERLQDLMPGCVVRFRDNPDLSDAAGSIADLPPGGVLLLENMRFHAGEEKNDPELCRQLATLGDVFVNDAFGASHRAHASTEGVGRFLSPCVAGLLMEKEIRALSGVLESPEPVTAIIGGSKISTKITVLKHLLPKVRHMIIGGGMIFTFLKAQGHPVGQSLVEEAFVETAHSLLEQIRTEGRVTLLLPEDVVVADRFAKDAESMVVPADHIPDGQMGLDIGPRAIQAVRAVLEQSPVVLWNGPLGVFEFPRFAEGTRAVAQSLAQRTMEGRCKSILGGGDTVAALEQFGMPPSSFTHVSTGGGASLEFLEGRILPGIAILDECETPVPQA